MRQINGDVNTPWNTKGTPLEHTQVWQNQAKTTCSTLRLHKEIISNFLKNPTRKKRRWEILRNWQMLSY